MASTVALQRLHRLIWVLIYGGLIALILGAFAARADGDLGWGLAGGGAVAVAAGIVLVWVRSRLREGPPPQ